MLNWNKFSLRKQLLILFLFLQLLILMGLMVYFNYHERSFYLAQLKTELINEGKLILENVEPNFNSTERDYLDKWIKDIGKKIAKRITIIDQYGNVLADSHFEPAKMDNHRQRPEVNLVLQGKSLGTSQRKSPTLHTDMYYLALPIIIEDQLVGVLRLSKSLKEIEAIIWHNFINYFLFFTFIFFLFLLLTSKFTKNIIKPLSKITALARNLAKGNFSQRVNLQGYQNEIGTLAQMFNFMAAQMEYKIKELVREKKRAEAILTSMVGGVIATDGQKKIQLINPAAREMFSIQEADIRGRKVIEIVRHHKVDSLLEKSLQENKIIKDEISIQKREKKIFQCNFAPITDQHGLVSGGVIVFTDVTELRKLEQVRTEFVANVSHELRTPLTSIIGYLDTILENEIRDYATLERFLAIIKMEADRLSFLINDLLELSKLESREVQPPLVAANLKELINKVLLILGEKAREKQITLLQEVNEKLPPALMVQEQIEQVLVNLVDNGIKYNRPGGMVKVKAYLQAERIIVEVEDNGLGIPPEDQERIFERFYRVDKARSRALGGTGIGLSIVKHIIQNHRSKIEVVSSPGKGSLFRFYLEKA